MNLKQLKTARDEMLKLVDQIALTSNRPDLIATLIMSIYTHFDELVGSDTCEVSGVKLTQGIDDIVN